MSCVTVKCCYSIFVLCVYFFDSYFYLQFVARSPTFCPQCMVPDDEAFIDAW